MAGIGTQDDEEGDAPGLLQSFGHMLGQTGVGPVDLSPGVGAGHIAVRGAKPAGLMQSGAGASVPRVAVPPPEPTPKITAYHGTPHDFDQFDISKIGTGEGAQVYGHGLYFAESPGVAQSYKDALAQAPTIDGKQVQIYAKEHGAPPDALRALQHAEGKVPEAIDYLQSMKGMMPALDKGIESDIQWLHANKERLGYNPGHLYQVEINADPSHFLDWDKPLSEQSPEVQAKLTPQALGLEQKGPVGVNNYFGHFDPVTGKPVGPLQTGRPPDQLFQPHETGMAIAKRINDDPARASEIMRAAGIPGIRYLDQGSRGPSVIYDVGAPRPDFGPYSPYTTKADAQKQLDLLRSHGFHDAEIKEKPQPQSRNYVVFDDKHVNITHKNGVKVTPVEHDPFKEEYSSGGVVQFSDYSGKLTPIDYDPFQEGIAA